MSRFGARSQLLSLWRRKDGATAVEFALVAIPFFWIMFAIAEIASLSLIQTSLDAAVSETARTIRTGEAQAASVTQSGFKEDVCDYVNNLMSVDCDAHLHIDVRRFADFDAVGRSNPVVNGDIDPTRLAFQPGAASEVVMVRAFYNWRIITPVFGDVFANMTGGRRLLVSSALFRNEPF